MSDVERWGCECTEVIKGVWAVHAGDYDALAAENARLREALTKAADTFADAARTFSVFGKNAAASSMLIAEEHTRAAVQPSEKRT